MKDCNVPLNFGRAISAHPHLPLATAPHNQPNPTPMDKPLGISIWKTWQIPRSGDKEVGQIPLNKDEGIYREEETLQILFCNILFCLHVSLFFHWP